MDAKREYLLLLDLLYRVVQSRARQEEADPRRYDCHKLATKLYLHAATLYWLGEGTRAPVPKPGGTNCIDISSGIVITRAALETYLRMHELFFQAITDDEREFRYAHWLLAGFVVREQFPLDDPALQAKVDDSRRFVADLRARLEGTERFARLTKRQRKDALKGNLQPRPFRHRVHAAGFGPDTTRMMYQYYSGYAHADGLSVVQIMQADSQQEQKRLMEGCFHMVMATLSKVIVQYEATYESAALCCRAAPEALKLAKIYAGAASQLR